MSNTTATERRPLADAIADAEAFRDLFPAACYERWEVAGSVRRRRETVGDVEHVVIPTFGDVAGLGLFAERANLLWHHLDALVRGGHLAKHWYGASGHRWGEVNRGVDFRGFRHEIYLADVDGGNWGSVLAIRTGPAELSQRLVTRLKQFGYDHVGGFRVMHLASREIVPVPDERTYFRLCGERCLPPERRS